MAFRAKHLLGIETLGPDEIVTLLDLAETYVTLNRQPEKHANALAGIDRKSVV